jgi:hypothetical protein
MHTLFSVVFIFFHLWKLSIAQSYIALNVRTFNGLDNNGKEGIVI